LLYEIIDSSYVHTTIHSNVRALMYRAHKVRVSRW